MLKENDIQIDSEQIASEDGSVQLFLKHLYLKDSAPLVQFLIIHDICHYHSDYLFFAKQIVKMAPKNVKVSLLDLRGQGLSSGLRGHIEDIEYYYGDVRTAINSINASNVPMFVIGMGTGALITLGILLNNYLKNEISGIIVHDIIINEKIGGLDFIKKSLSKTSLGKKVRVPYACSAFDNVWSFDGTMPSLSLENELIKLGRFVRENIYFLSTRALFIGNERKIKNIEDTLLKKVDKGIVDIIYEDDSECLTAEVKMEDYLIDEIHNWVSEISCYLG